MTQQQYKISSICIILTIFNLVGIWGLMVAPYVLGIIGIDLPIEPPIHFVNATLALVFIACGVGLRSVIDIAKAYFGRGKSNDSL